MCCIWHDCFSALYYQYLLWQGNDVRFLSNALPPAVGVAAGFAGMQPTAGASNRPAANTARSNSSGSSSSSSARVDVGGVTGAPSGPGTSDNSDAGAEHHVTTEGLPAPVTTDSEASSGQQSKPSRKESQRKRLLEEQKAYSEQIVHSLTQGLGEVVTTALQPSAASASPGMKNAKKRSYEASASLHETQARLVQIQTEGAEQKNAMEEKRARQDLLQRTINDPSFEKLPEASRARILYQYEELVLH